MGGTGCRPIIKFCISRGRPRRVGGSVLSESLPMLSLVDVVVERPDVGDGTRKPLAVLSSSPEDSQPPAASDLCPLAAAGWVSPPAAVPSCSVGLLALATRTATSLEDALLDRRFFCLFALR